MTKLRYLSVAVAWFGGRYVLVYESQNLNRSSGTVTQDCFFVSFILSGGNEERNIRLVSYKVIRWKLN